MAICWTGICLSIAIATKVINTSGTHEKRFIINDNTNELCPPTSSVPLPSATIPQIPMLLWYGLFIKTVAIHWACLTYYLSSHLIKIKKFKKYESWLKILLRERKIFSIKVKTFLDINQLHNRNTTSSSNSISITNTTNTTPNTNSITHNNIENDICNGHNRNIPISSHIHNPFSSNIAPNNNKNITEDIYASPPHKTCIKPTDTLPIFDENKRWPNADFFSAYVMKKLLMHGKQCFHYKIQIVKFN